MRRESARIIEQPNGWLWAEHGHVYKTAAHALRAVTQADAKAAKAGSSTIRTITWVINSRSGKSVVTALQ